jgi:hypothetical protein
MSTQILLLAAGSAIVVVLGLAWLLRERLSAFSQLHRWPTDQDLQAAKAERARRRAINQNVGTAKKSLREAQRAQQGRVKAEEKQLELAKTTRSQAVTLAQASLQTAERTHSAALSEAQKSLDLWRTPGSGQKLGAYKDVTLFQHQIRTAQGTCSTLRAKATVDTAGNLAVTRRVTFTRLIALGVVGGLLFKKKDKDDKRELYLLVETADFASVTKCEPNDGPKVRQLAAKITTAALQEDRFETQRPSEIARYQRELDAAKQDRAEIDLAQLRLHQVESDPELTARIETAQRALADTVADTGESEAARTRLNEVMVLAKSSRSA